MGWDVGGLIKQVGDTVGDTVRRVQDEAGHAGQNVQRAVHRVQDGVGHAVHDAGRNVQRAIHRVQDGVVHAVHDAGQNVQRAANEVKRAFDGALQGAGPASDRPAGSRDRHPGPADAATDAKAPARAARVPARDAKAPAHDAKAPAHDAKAPATLTMSAPPELVQPRPGGPLGELVQIGTDLSNLLQGKPSPYEASSHLKLTAALADQGLPATRDGGGGMAVQVPNTKQGGIAWANAESQGMVFDQPLPAGASPAFREGVEQQRGANRFMAGNAAFNVALDLAGGATALGLARGARAHGGATTPAVPETEPAFPRRTGSPEPPPTRPDALGSTVPNPAYLYAEPPRPPGVPDDAVYVVNIHYRHGKTNANSGTPMLTPEGQPVPAEQHLVNTNGMVVPGTSWYAGNKLGNWVQLLPQSREQARLLQPVVSEFMQTTAFVTHSPVQRAIDTMELATGGNPGRPTISMDGLAERGVAGLFGSPKTDEFKAMTSDKNYLPPVVIPNPMQRWTQTPDATGPESENMFLDRMVKTAHDLNARNATMGNGIAFSHQYTIAGLQDAQYKMTQSGESLGVSRFYMPDYGVHHPTENPDGFLPPMEAGHHIPNGATLARPGWVFKDESGRVQFVPAQKGWSDLGPPSAQEPPP